MGVALLEVVHGGLNPLPPGAVLVGLAHARSVLPSSCLLARTRGNPSRILLPRHCAQTRLGWRSGKSTNLQVLSCFNPPVAGSASATNSEPATSPEGLNTVAETTRKVQKTDRTLLPTDVLGPDDVIGADNNAQFAVSNGGLSSEESSVLTHTEEEGVEQPGAFLGSELDMGMFEQFLEIVKFAGPALGIWLTGPLMSLIDTAVVGQISSLDLAALGPGTVLCDYLCYVFMFLSIATSNLVATSLANEDLPGVAHHLSRLLFVALVCGFAMLITLGCFYTPILKAFVGPTNASLIPSAGLYVKIRALAWPAALVGMVAQSASLGMQDSWSPLRVLAIGGITNCFGDILFCMVLGHGIAGAAWATTIAQYLISYLMLQSLNAKGYNALDLRVPSTSELARMVELAAPVLLTTFSKVSFYTVITYLATSLGTVTLAAHQVMIGVYSLCTVSGEPLAQTAQSFMPALIQGSNKNLKKARTLLRSLLYIGFSMGLFLGLLAISIPWFSPHLFTQDQAIIQQMRSITLPFLGSLIITPPTLSLEGTLLAGRDLKFLSFSMASCFIGGTIMLLTFNSLSFGLRGSWWTLNCFQLARFLQAFFRIRSAKSVLRDKSIPLEGALPHLKNA